MYICNRFCIAKFTILQYAIKAAKGLLWLHFQESVTGLCNTKEVRCRHMFEFSFYELYWFILAALGMILTYRSKNGLLEFMTTVIDMILTHSNKGKGDKDDDETQNK